MMVKTAAVTTLTESAVRLAEALLDVAGSSARTVLVR
jgi:hypothetical protein